MRFHKNVVVVVFAVILLMAAGCMRYENYSSDLTRSFEKQILHDFPKIHSFHVGYSPSAIMFFCDMDKTVSKGELKPIFIEARVFFETKEFQKEFFNAYFKEYNTEPRYYPEVGVSFDTNGDGVEDYRFRALPDKGSLPQSPKYSHWTLLKADGTFTEVNY